MNLVAAGALVALAACHGTPPAPPPGKPPAVALDHGEGGKAPAPEPEIVLEPVDPMAAGMTVASVSALCGDNLALAQKLLDAIRRVDLNEPQKLDWSHTFGRFDDALLAIANASEFPFLAGVVHPDEAVRTAAQACEKKTDALETAMYLDGELARPLKAFAERGEQLSEERQRFVEHVLREFRRNGVDLPRPEQERIRKINAQMTELGQRFIAELGASQPTLEIRSEQLAGLGASFKKNHPAGKDGKVVISTDYPDYYEFVTYALDRNAARDLYVKFVNRGGDANVARLDRILALRHEKALLLGYDNWADYAIEPRMAKKASEASAFLARVKDAIAAPVARELREFRGELDRLPNAVPNRPMIEPDRYFLADRIKKKKLKLDTQAVADYFEIDAVTKGLFDVTAAMYGLEYREVAEKAWDPSVRAYEVWLGGKAIAKFYLDLFPRPNKYKHAAMFSIRTGKTLASGVRQTPMAALVCNFPAPGEPMPHDQVVTYFHEFGHVLQHILTDTELAAFAGTNTVRDFVEAPSQMFEEWVWSAEVLARFARQRKTGDKMPAAMLEALVKSRRVGLALATERQLFLAELDLGFHTAHPPFDTNAILEQVQQQSFSFSYVKGTHFQSSFSHLIGYDAGYYGYQWGMAIALDVLTRFRQEGLMNGATAADWKNAVLARGGARDERAMIRQFLGREPSEKAYFDFLAAE